MLNAYGQLVVIVMADRFISSCRVPVDPHVWQISQDTATGVAECLASTLGAAESVLRVAATGHDKKLFFKVIN